MPVESVIRGLVRSCRGTTVPCVLSAWQGRLGAAWWNGGHGWIELSPAWRFRQAQSLVDRLLDKLRAELRDDSFLRDARVVIAHPSRRSLFVDTYCWNYVQDDNQLGKRVRRGSFLLTEQKSFDKEKIYQSRLDESKQRYLD